MFTYPICGALGGTADVDARFREPGTGVLTTNTSFTGLEGVSELGDD